ncbi:MAG: hypothetical protein JWQ29_2604 [Phenylobacterium sp.]|nr:hypothetical protein [Phenylobacterium sp.]
MRTIHKLRWLTASSTVLAFALTCAPEAMAQTATNKATTATTGAELGEVLVTGRKRASAEILQETPISATAVTAQQIEAAHAVDLIDLGRLTPGVSFQQANSAYYNDFQMRGMGNSGTSPQDEPPVGIIYDGIYLGTGTGANLDLFDVQEVSILRGPQGTLFGRNVTGGAVVINTNNASFTKRGVATASYGRFGDYEGTLVLNGPLLGDVVAGRLALRGLHNGGWAKNPNRGRNVGENDDMMIRGALLIRPTDDIDVNLKLAYQMIDGDAQPVRGLAPSTAPASTLVPVPIFTYPTARGAMTPTDFWTVNNPNSNEQKIATLAAIGQVDWRVLGGVVTLVEGHRKVKSSSDQNFDGTIAESFRSSGHYYQWQSSTELRFAQEIGKFNYTVGGYYFLSWLDSAQRRALRSNTFSTSAALNPICATNRNNTTPLCVTGSSFSDNVQRAYQTTWSTALFAEGDYSVTDKLTLTLGVRQTREHKRAVVAGFTPIQNFGDCTVAYSACRFGPTRTYAASNISPKAGLSYKFSTDHLLFGSVTTGFRSGGYALRGAALTFAPYSAEKVTAYEIGSKNDFLDNRLRLNATVYLNKYKDLQRTVTQQDPQIGIIQSTFNAATATIYGVELEGVAKLNENWSVTAVYGYLHAKYDSFAGLTNAAGVYTAYAPVGKLKFNRVPDTTAGVSLNYDGAVGDVGTLAGRVGASYTSHYFFDDVNTPTNDQKAYTLVDASLAFTTADHDWTVTVYGKNITKTKYAQAGANLGGNGQNFYLGKPVTYGIKLAREF